MSLGDRDTDTKPTVVLVHGAFEDGSVWDPVVERLSSDYTLVVAANPLRGVDPDSASLAALLRLTDGPIILVGHAYGGVAITNAGCRSGDVKALVYVSALAPRAARERQGPFRAVSRKWPPGGPGRCASF